MFEYQAVSHNVLIRVKPEYADDKSDIFSQKFVFIYHIVIENNSQETLQLLRRSWLIKDGIGDIYEVNGEGVVGKQPLLKPGEQFSYQSYCVLKSPAGSMEGFYEMTTDSQKYRILIPKFHLRSHILN
ncbi:Co2+/Mg2+ efflux protein ApaG [bacterium]|nr:MAG: Co2+/Mg2+ efflux protein ApaG [bacterium]